MIAVICLDYIGLWLFIYGDIVLRPGCLWCPMRVNDDCDIGSTYTRILFSDSSTGLTFPFCQMTSLANVQIVCVCTCLGCCEFCMKVEVQCSLKHHSSWFGNYFLCHLDYSYLKFVGLCVVTGNHDLIFREARWLTGSFCQRRNGTQRHLVGVQDFVPAMKYSGLYHLEMSDVLWKSSGNWEETRCSKAVSRFRWFLSFSRCHLCCLRDLSLVLYICVV